MRQQLSPAPDPRAAPEIRDAGGLARHGRGFVRRATLAVVAIAAATSTVLLAGCENLVDPPPGLRVHVVNHTDLDLTVRNLTTVIGKVDASASDDVRTGTSKSYCLTGGVTATSKDGAWVATPDAEVCDGDEWVIEPDDLEPAPAPESPSPTSSSG